MAEVGGSAHGNGEVAPGPRGGLAKSHLWITYRLSIDLDC
jgi:hypothetical protein